MLAASFGCPCHGGLYDSEGNRNAGPPVRSLDRFEFSIRNGNLVLGRLFSVGNVEGTGAKARISKYYRAYPGVHVDGHREVALSDSDAGVDELMAKSARRQQLETVALYPLDWVEERSGLVGYTKWFLFRKVPRDISWAQTLGAASLTAFIVQAVTGVFLAMYYKPDPDNAYASVQNITEDVTLGWLVRGMHKWGASVFIILMFFHMARTFLFGAYKYPRELNWVDRRPDPRARACRGLHGLPAPVGQHRLLGHGRRDQPERDRADRRAVPRPVPPGRAGHRPRHAGEVLRPAHAADPGRDHGADRAAPVPRRAPRRHLAAVVGDGRGPRAPRGGGPREG